MAPGEATPLSHCPAAINLPGAHAPCPCAELTARFKTAPPVERCPATETIEAMRARHEEDTAAARAASVKALHELAVAIREARSRADALEALARRDG